MIGSTFLKAKLCNFYIPNANNDSVLSLQDKFRKIVASVVEWLKRHGCDRNGLDPKPTRVILLCPKERHFPLFDGLG